VLGAQEVAQPLLDLLARHRRVAIGVQQALLGRQQRALAVDRDGPALQHERRLVATVAQAVDELAAHRGVAVVGRELLAPRVEAEVHAGAAPVASSTKIGPLSRSQESSIASSTTSTSPVSAARASAASCPPAQTMVSGSKAATAFAVAA
jgi:hypothetical protein